jgi:taurine dioxygenase
MLAAPHKRTNQSIPERLQRRCAVSGRQSEVIVTPSSGILGATVEGLDLSAPLAQQELDAVLRALGQHAVIRFPSQRLTARELAEFSGRFGELEVNVANAYQEPGLPQVMILSNIVENGKPIGLADAGQGWHTDMSYSRMIAFANVLYGIQIPHRDGVPLGATEFSDMRAAYDDLPEELKRRLDGMTALHDFNKFWETMRREKGSQRPPLTEAQRKAKPATSHPLFLVHPLTGRKVLYANPGYTVRINELSERESEETLQFLFAHQLQPKYRYVHRWQTGDVLMWDDLSTIHQAAADYGPDEHRLIKRCQVMATRFFRDR